MRLEAAVGIVDGVIEAVFSLLTVFILPICAIIYCGGGQSKSEKSKVALSTMETGTTVPDEGPSIPDAADDNRPQWAETVLENHTIASLTTEYIRNLENYQAPKRTTFASDKNALKNRYVNIPCFDQDRVILKGRSGILQGIFKKPSDYIHANYVNAPDGVKYIATQGPLAKTRSDFWQMVVQEEATVILQLCSFVEGGTQKCAKYWPEKEATTVLDRFKIRKIGKQEEIAPGAVMTKLSIESKSDKRTIQHVLCSCWPDQLAPSDPDTIIKIWNYVKDNRGKGPIVVHCSAGIGRTGTFIALSFGSEMLKKSGTTTMNIVKELRKYRQQAVQSHIQYWFLHVVLLELFMQKNVVPRTPKAAEFLEAFQKALEKYAKR